MKQKRFKEIDNKGQVCRVVTINQETANRLTKSKKHEFTYELEKRESNEESKLIVLNDKQFDLKLVINSYNQLEGVAKINKNTGEEKVLKAIEALEAEVKEALVSSLTK
ncbi:hypothetical protein BTO06_09830 [Tenacibaculum sp. SZ-18]|uniref:hypothetical protein n=1 Tax=Tenacibaculum sp. SZ-18 TaxID=754423 RepID=UPI000C2D32CE|nr:hypothetical protein [Tenacibaculum sp. SZ-18]AUC15419.1 hypothetical protein BTO06_09830 [Tenacibaculum sp. SZ-18]